MNFTEQQIQNNFLREIAELSLPVQVVIDNAAEIANCRLVYKLGREKKLFIRMKKGDYPVMGNVNFTCTYANALYKFNSNIICSDKTDPEYHYLQIQIPEKMTIEERRRFFRVKPSEQKPVNVSFTLPDSRIITVEALDISGGGLSIVIPSDITVFHVNQCISLSISLPDFSTVDTNAVIKGIFRLLNMDRIGMAFLNITEATQSVLMQYNMLREAEMIEEGQHEAPQVQKARVCLIEESYRLHKYIFLEKFFQLVKIDFFNTMPRLVAHPPELIIINTDVPEALTLFPVIRANQLLKYIPFLLVSSCDADIDLPQDAIILNYSSNENLLVKTAKQLIDKYTHLKKLQRKKLTIIAGRGHKIFIIDRFHKFGDKNAEFLTINGFEVIIDDSEENILARIVKAHPDIIILDEETEKTDPVSLCQLINMNMAIRRIPKIILTSEEKNFERLYSQGFFAGYLIKPISTDQLLAKLFKLIPPDEE
jgi:c-di-GMP-binding flagellar brake protein YcgR/CheY-like chemotaxis protein